MINEDGITATEILNRPAFGKEKEKLRTFKISPVPPHSQFYGELHSTNPAYPFHKGKIYSVKGFFEGNAVLEHHWTDEPKIFNEETLLAEIEKTWGKAGAHADLFRTILNQRASVKKKVIEHLKKMMPKENVLPDKFTGTDVLEAIEFGMEKQENAERLVYERAIKEIDEWLK